MAKVQLELTAIGDESKVILDGKDIAAGVRSLALHAGPAGTPTTMTLELNLLHHVTPVEADAEILIPDATRGLLERLGWTPPETS